MNSFFSSKLGPKNSKFGILNSKIHHNDNRLHQIRSQTLSITTVPFDLSNSGDFLCTIAFFVPSQKIDIEICTKFSTNRHTFSSPRGPERDLPWIHSPMHSLQDFSNRLTKVVKRTVGHGLVPASCQVGPDDSHGVASSRNSSGECIQTNDNFIVYSHSKIVPGLSTDDRSVWTEFELLGLNFSAHYTKFTTGPLVYGVIGVTPCPLEMSEIYIPALICATLDERPFKTHQKIQHLLSFLHKGTSDPF